MCRLISAAVRASTSSKSSEEFTSSPISASVFRTSAEISVFSVAVVSVAVACVCSLAGFMNSYHYSRQPRSGCGSSFYRSFGDNPFWRWQVGRETALRIAVCLFAWFSRFVLGLQREHCDSLQIAVTLRIVQPKPHHEFVRDAKSHIVRPHRRDAPFRLVQQYRHPQPLRFALFKNPQEVLQGHPRIQNIFHYNDRPALDTSVEIFCESYLP